MLGLQELRDQLPGLATALDAAAAAAAVTTPSSGTDWQRRWRRAARGCRRGVAARRRPRVERRPVVATAAAAAAGAAAITAAGAAATTGGRRSNPVRHWRRLHVALAPHEPRHGSRALPPRRRRRRPCSLDAVNCAASRELVAVVGMMEDATRTLSSVLVRTCLCAGLCACAREGNASGGNDGVVAWLVHPVVLALFVRHANTASPLDCHGPLPNPPPRRAGRHAHAVAAGGRVAAPPPSPASPSCRSFAAACATQAPAAPRSTCRSRSCTPWRRASTWTARRATWELVQNAVGQLLRNAVRYSHGSAAPSSSAFPSSASRRPWRGSRSCDPRTLRAGHVPRCGRQRR